MTIKPSFKVFLRLFIVFFLFSFSFFFPFVFFLIDGDLWISLRAALILFLIIEVVSILPVTLILLSEKIIVSEDKIILSSTFGLKKRSVRIEDIKRIYEVRKLFALRPRRMLFLVIDSGENNMNIAFRRYGDEDIKRLFKDILKKNPKVKVDKNFIKRHWGEYSFGENE